jgi:hypothetical protein
MLVAPERRMSSRVMTKTAAAVCDNDSPWRETEVTSTFMRSPIFITARSFGSNCEWAAEEDKGRSPAAPRRVRDGGATEKRTEDNFAWQSPS